MIGVNYFFAGWPAYYAGATDTPYCTFREDTTMEGGWEHTLSSCLHPVIEGMRIYRHNELVRMVRVCTCDSSSEWWVGLYNTRRKQFCWHHYTWRCHCWRSDSSDKAGGSGRRVCLGCRIVYVGFRSKRFRKYEEQSNFDTWQHNVARLCTRPYSSHQQRSRNLHYACPGSWVRDSIDGTPQRRTPQRQGGHHPRPGLYQPRAVEGSTRRRHTHQREGCQLLARTSWRPQAQIAVRTLADVLPGDRHVVYSCQCLTWFKIAPVLLLSKPDYCSWC